jgi:ribosomal protein S18 acetylase RimI-like enzyme
MAGLFGNLWLARRLEKAEADNARHLPAAIEIGGGVVAFAGPYSPLTHALGLGMDGEVDGDKLDRVEYFYRERDTPTVIEVCPLADPSLFDLLGRRAYRITEFNNVLVRTIDPPPAEITSQVRRTEPSEEPTWSQTVAEGFFERDQFTEEELRMGSLLFRAPGTIPWLAFVDGRPAAAAAMIVRDHLATLFADSTIAAYRRQGLQTNLIRARMQYAAEAGCDLITASTVPGSPSQLNYERLGFRIVYTKLIFTKP